MNLDTAIENDVAGVIRIEPDTNRITYIAFGDACRVNSDGSIEINPKYETTYAAVEFWRAVAAMAPNMIDGAALAITRLEALSGVGWYIGKGRETRSEPLYACAIVVADNDGLTRGHTFEVVAEADSIVTALDRAMLAYHTSTSVPVDHPRNYVIWSNEHRAWWRPGRCGYATSLADAGLYTRDDAMAIVTAATLGHEWTGWMPPNEICTCIDDLPEQARALLQPRVEA